MIEESHPIEKIHHINRAFNRRFANVLYYCGALVTFLLLALPYSLRTALAFFVNIFFNRPRVYIEYARRVGNRLNVLPMLVLYSIGIGVYAILFQLARAFRREKVATRWMPLKFETVPAWYDHQS